MAAVPSDVVSLSRSRRQRIADRSGDYLLQGATGGALLVAVAVLFGIIYKILDGARLSFHTFGLSFFTHSVWDPVHAHFGALDFVFGTVVTSAIALLLATPISIAVGLFLSELAPRSVRGVIGTLVEMLAAVPSVILGLWGIFVLSPFMHNYFEPFLSRAFGWIPIFGHSVPSTGSGILTAGLILAIMVVPIVSSISRELFLGVPEELEHGALALGATRWEMVRGVILPSARSGVVAAVILGLGRALGEAIAVTAVVGGTPQITRSLFNPGDTIASKIAAQYLNAVTKLEVSSLFYLAAILLVIGLLTNGVAQIIVRRFEVRQGVVAR
jgi:phosphate transport system permease protein